MLPDSLELAAPGLPSRPRPPPPPALLLLLLRRCELLINFCASSSEKWSASFPFFNQVVFVFFLSLVWVMLMMLGLRQCTRATAAAAAAAACTGCRGALQAAQRLQRRQLLSTSSCLWKQGKAETVEEIPVSQLEQGQRSAHAQCL